ncbi:hypothetical protein RIF29_00780 [Crotalaria pallida]|uniref:Uncharacterized protein n=1 Tax=Crotalaria pallida TaxID=3830 RepID=A0AAN9IW34_CROPI
MYIGVSNNGFFYQILIPTLDLLQGHVVFLLLLNRSRISDLECWDEVEADWTTGLGLTLTHPQEYLREAIALGPSPSVMSSP